MKDSYALIDQLTSEIRTISHLLHPPLLDEVGLVSALRWYVDGFSQRSNITATLDMPENLERLPDNTEIAIFRAVQDRPYQHPPALRQSFLFGEHCSRYKQFTR